MSKARNPRDLNINEWQDLLSTYNATVAPRPGGAFRIENTPFTSARYCGGMHYQGETYTYFEPRVPDHAPNPDGTLFVAWLMVRDDFLRWVSDKMKKEGEGNVR